MKKAFSILITCALLLSLVSVVSLADTDAQRSVPLLGVVVDGVTETQELPVDGMGGVSVPGTGGWKAWVSYWTDEVADFAPEAGEKLYLVYDMTVATGTNVQFTINGWNNPISKELAGAAAELGEGGVYSIPGGTYSGALELDRAQIGENGRIGVLGNGIDIRTCALVCTAGTPKTPDPAPSKAPTEPPAPKQIAESAGIDLISVITNGTDETDTTEITDNGSGFVISQPKAWNVWVLNYAAEAAEFQAADGEKLWLVYDFTTSGDVHLCVNGWNNSVAADIAAAAGAKTAAAEDGTPMLKAGTYQGAIEVTKDMIGENGRFGLRGVSSADATIRTFRLVSGVEGESTGTQGGSDTTKKAADPTTKPTQPAGLKGDANSDEVVNMKDVLLLRKYLAGIDASPDMAASDVNNDGAVNMKDVLMIRKYIAGIIKSFDDVDPTDPTEPTEPTEPQGKPVTGELDLIEVITNGTDETDGTAIKDEGNGFVINQSKDWNVWVLYFNENAPFFYAREGENVFLEYDMTLNGDAHLNVNGWNNSIAAAIAAASGASTTFAEDGTPMLVQGTYAGKVQIDPSLFGETGRLGIVGKGAVIRTFRLVSIKGGTDTTASSKATADPTATVPSKTTPPTQSGTPYLNYETSEKFGSLGVWWWNANQISNESQRKQRLDFLQQNGVTEIYLCVTSQSFDDVADFIIDAGSRGMRVSWLSGDVSWIQSGNTGFDGMFARFKAYQNQAPANAKFYGIHLDVEPHQAGSTQSNWQMYADLVMRATKDAHDFGTLIEWDIPFWLDDMTVTVGGKTQKLLNVLAENSDTLTLMSYRDTAAAILDAGAQEIPLGSQYNCKIILGVETYSEEGEYVSFMEDGKAAMYSALTTVLSTLSGKDTLSAGYGCAVHYVDTWMNLKN